jgi:arylsulfatase A-like enzyme
VYYHYYEFPGAHSVQKHYGVRTERYKLIHFYDIEEWELYDLKKDPQEMRSVYSDPDYAKVVVDMKRKLEELRESYQDDGTVIQFPNQQKQRGKRR